MRGLACVLMFQTHCYDAWLGGDARNTSFLKGSQLLGTLPAPLFLFLAGISFALVTDKLIRKNLTPAEITRTMARRGAEIFAFGLLFRLQEFLIAWGWAPWSDLLRVDVLNIIGLSMILMALTCGMVLHSGDGRTHDSYQSMPQACRKPGMAPVWPLAAMSSHPPSIAVAALIALLTPPLYTTWRPTWLPWPLESYINGCHNLGAPQPWLFPLFPWSAFAFAGLAAGFHSLQRPGPHSNRAKRWRSSPLSEPQQSSQPASSTILLFHLYSTYDYWHTSPNFLMMRVGMLVSDCFFELCLVPLGPGNLGLQPADPTRPDIIARLLGAHRIRLRTLLLASQTSRIHPHRLARIVGNLLYSC